MYGIDEYKLTLYLPHWNVFCLEVQVTKIKMFKVNFIFEFHSWPYEQERIMFTCYLDVNTSKQLLVG